MKNKTIHHYHSTVNQYFYDSDKLNLIIQELKSIKMTQAEALQKLTAISGTLDKVKTESAGSLTKIDELKALLEQQGNLNPEVEAIINEIESKVKAVDDLIVDTPVDQPGNPSEGGTGTVDQPSGN